MNRRIARMKARTNITSHRSAALHAMRVLLLVVVASATITTASAGTLNGTVKNGTTGQVAAGADVILIQLQGGMQPVANTKTDAQGHFSFNNPQLGTGPMLVRVVYKGVNYHEPITPGKMSADIEVFEPTTDPKSFSIANHAIILQPNGSDLMVGEEYMIANKTQPPARLLSRRWLLRFHAPRWRRFQSSLRLGLVRHAGSAGHDRQRQK